MKNIIFLLLLVSTCVFAQKDTGETSNGSIAINYAAFTTPSGCTSAATVIAHEINVLNSDFSIAAFAYIDLENGFSHSSDIAIVDVDTDGSFTINDATYTDYRTRVAQSCKMGCCRIAVKWTDWVYGTGGGDPTPTINTNDDHILLSEAGVVTIVDVTPNDTSSDCEPITYTVSNEVNCTVTNNNDGTFDVTPTVNDVWSFDYTGTCSDGVTNGTSTVNGDAEADCDECTPTVTMAGITFLSGVNNFLINGGGNIGNQSNASVDITWWDNTTQNFTNQNLDISGGISYTYGSSPSTAGIWSNTIIILDDNGNTITHTINFETDASGTVISPNQSDNANVVPGGRGELWEIVNIDTCTSTVEIRIAGSGPILNNDTEIIFNGNNYLIDAFVGGNGNLTAYAVNPNNIIGPGIYPYTVNFYEDGGSTVLYSVEGVVIVEGCDSATPTITVNNDVVTDSTEGVETTVDASLNDSSTDCEPITYAVVFTDNCTVVNNNDGTFDVTPSNVGVWSFEYTATCSDGSTSGLGIVSGDASNSSTPADPCSDTSGSFSFVWTSFRPYVRVDGTVLPNSPYTLGADLALLESDLQAELTSLGITATLSLSYDGSDVTINWSGGILVPSGTSIITQSSPNGGFMAGQIGCP